ncbi:MAG: hypothetical protein GY842_12825 [bacterium]|nr:hypothetical protein [bacterium]
MVAATLALLTSGLWIVAAVQDLRRRELSAFVLVALTALSLPGRAWPWWALAAAALLWPLRWRRRAMLLAPLALVVGLATGEPEPGVALATGIVAWALSWWGGADGIALLALALRHGLPGMIAGALFAATMGIALMLRRRRPLWRLAAAVSDVLTLRQQTGEIPADAEMPAATALAVGGLTMEVITLCRTIFG